MEREIKNKIILVTGGSSGLGLSMADSFLEKGAKILIITDVNEEQGSDTTKKMCAKYGENRAVFYKCDITLDLEETFKKVIDTHQYVDVLINNAGILNEKSVKKTMDINATALMEWTVKFYDFMRKDRQGRGGTIINVSSVYGVRITPFMAYYHASKYAVIGFSKSLGHEYNFKRSGIRVVVLCPGLTYTNLSAKPSCRDDESLPDFITNLQGCEWQNADAIGKGILEIFEKAESGTVWLVEGARSAVMI